MNITIERPHYGDHKKLISVKYITKLVKSAFTLVYIIGGLILYAGVFILTGNKDSGIE